MHTQGLSVHLSGIFSSVDWNILALLLHILLLSTDHQHSGMAGQTNVTNATSHSSNLRNHNDTILSMRRQTSKYEVVSQEIGPTGTATPRKQLFLFSRKQSQAFHRKQETVPKMV